MPLVMGLQNSATAEVSITVSAVNDAPVANDDAYGLLAGSTIKSAAAAGVLANDVDVDGPPLSATLAATTSNGALSLVG